MNLICVCGVSMSSLCFTVKMKKWWSLGVAYLGVYSSKHRPNRLPPSSIIFSFSLWIKAMTLRLHRRKWGWLHSNGNHTWFIYSIICPIYRFVSKLEPWFIWHCDAFEKLQCQMNQGSSWESESLIASLCPWRWRTSLAKCRRNFVEVFLWLLSILPWSICILFMYTLRCHS